MPKRLENTINVIGIVYRTVSNNNVIGVPVVAMGRYSVVKNCRIVTKRIIEPTNMNRIGLLVF